MDLMEAMGAERRKKNSDQKNKRRYLGQFLRFIRIHDPNNTS